MSTDTSPDQLADASSGELVGNGTANAADA